MGLIDTAKRIAKSKDKLDEARQVLEEREAHRETEARGRMLNRQDTAINRYAAGKLTNEAFEERFKESKDIYERERKTPERRLKERAVTTGHQLQTVRAPKQNYSGSLPSLPSDPFGMGHMGNPFAPPRPEPAPRPRRKKAKKRKSAPARRHPPARSSGMMGGIPKHMQWMF